MKITDKLEAKDRGIVREVRVPKMRDEALEKEYSDVISAHKEAKKFLQKKTQIEKDLNSELASVVLVGQKIEEDMKTIEANKKKIDPLIKEQEGKIDALRADKKREREKELPEKEDDKKRAEATQKEEIRRINDLIIREEVVLGTYKQRHTNLHVDLLLLQTNHEKQSARFGELKEQHDKSVLEKTKAEELFVEVDKKLKEVTKKGEKFADDDLKNGETEIEEAREQLKYKKVRAIGQTADHWIFLLIQPEELEGEVTVTIDEKVDEVII